MEDLFFTPVLDEHKKLNAQLAPFGGWLMPIQYSGILNEHNQCRNSVSLFDICHMGEFYFKGNVAESGIENAFCYSLSKIPVGKCRYGFILNDNGCIIDDLIVYRISETELMLVVNAATTEKDFLAIKKHIKDSIFNNISSETAKFDIQGPLSRDLLCDLISEEVKTIPYFGFKQLMVLGIPAFVSRTGYTGELGYEIYINKNKAVELWNKILSDDRAKPAGLGSRDILRLEVGYSLYGNDIDEKTTPLEAGLENFVDFSKSFRGKEALLKQKEAGVKRIKIAFRTTSRRSPRQHYEILSNNSIIGEVTSGTFSPLMSCGIGLGFVKPEYSKPGTKLILRHESVEIEAEVCELPFYKGGSLKN